MSKLSDASRLHASPGWLGLVVLLGLALLAPAVVGAQGPPQREVEDLPDELLIGFTDEATDADVEDAVRAHGAARLEQIRGLKVHRVRVPPQARDAIERALARRPGVAFVERNKRHAVELVPNDPSFSRQYHHPRTQTPGAWDMTQGLPEIVIAILDTGVDGTHPDLTGKMVPGFNWFDNNTDTSDVHGHGTKVAGSAAATGNNAVGVTGVCWTCRIMPVRVTSPDGFAFTSTMANGIGWAVDHGAKVINISISGVAGSSTLRTASQQANSRGVVVVAGAGNCGCTEAIADNPFVISVSATDSSDRLASFSSRGDYVDVAAPGVSIYTTTRGGGYGSVSGTSFSGPITAGVIALMMAANPTLTPTDLDALLKANSDDLGAAGWDPNFGFGRINAFRAVAAAAASSPIPLPGPQVSPPPDVSNFAAAPLQTTPAVTLSWLNPTTNFAGTLVLRKAGAPVTEAPASGQSYAPGQSIGGATVLYAGASPAVSDSGVSPGTTYHYRAFAFSPAMAYASGVQSSATPTTVTPTTCASEIIVDNLPPGQSSATIAFTGTWATSASSGAFGANGSLYSNGSGVDTYTWRPGVLNSAGPCTYDVYVWWTAHSNRSTTVPITVAGHTGGSTQRTFNQRSGGGVWTLHGRYTWETGAQASVSVSDANGQAAADAVRFVLAPTGEPAPPPPPQEIIVDNSGPGTTVTGSWCVSSSAGFFGSNSLYSCGSGIDRYRWTPTIPTAGAYDVFVWWTAHANRSATVPITVTHAQGTTTNLFDQRTGGGQWQALGRFNFNAGTEGFVEVSDANGQACADAVRFVPVTTVVEAPQTQSP